MYNCSMIEKNDKENLKCVGCTDPAEDNELMAGRIAAKVADKGGRVFYVGGFVRDRLLGRENHDVDIEVHGIEPDMLRGILEELGTPLSYGQSFGIYSLHGCDIDIAMPRRERLTGVRHTDFEIDVDPFIGTREAARRRDFTINALMMDVLSGEIVDQFGGLDDLRGGIIRHVDDVSFAEDPLRVLRCAMFAARFGFAAAPETVGLCSGMDLSHLPPERIEGEMQKALLGSLRPSIFFETLREMDQLDNWFPELRDLIGVEQDPLYHPEGNVWIHTMQVADRAAQYLDRVSDPFSFMMLALTHDMGKTVTTFVKDGRIHAYGHEIEGVPIAEAFVTRITGNKAVLKYVGNMIPLHMRPNMLAFSKPGIKSTNRLFDEAAAPEDLIWFAMADRPVMAGDERFTGDSGFLFERLEIYRQIMAAPHVTGQDLIDAGLEPGKEFSDYLSYAHKLRLAGVGRESSLKQTLAYARKSLRKEKCIRNRDRND